MHTRLLLCVGLLLSSCLQLDAQNFIASLAEQDVNCASGEVCYMIQLSSNQTFDLGSSSIRLFYDCSTVEYLDGSANVDNLPISYSIVNELDQCVDASGLGTLPFEQTLAFLQIAIDHNIVDPIEIGSTSSTILQNICFTLLNDDILLDPDECFDLLWVTESTREGYVNSVTTISTVNGGLNPNNGQFISLNNTNNCFITDCVDIDDPCVPIVDADGDGVCDVGDNPDPDPTDPCVPTVVDADNDGVCDLGPNADPNPADPCIPNFADADGDGVCDINDDPDPTDPCNPNFDAAVCLDPTVAFELSFSNVTSVNCETNTICYDVNIRSTTRPFDLGSYNLRIFYDGALADAIDQSPTLSPSLNLNSNYVINTINDMQGGNQSGNGSLPFDSNLDIIDIAVDFTGNLPISIDSLNEETIVHQLCFEATSDNLLNNPLSCFQLVWVTEETEENYTVGITTVNVASTIGITADLDASSYVDLVPEENCFEFACIDDECSVLACNDNVQISLDSCVVVLDPDLLLEAPQFAPYSIDFFTTTGEFVRTDTLLGMDDGQTYGYRVRCQENSCWGTVRIESNIIPAFNAPCSCENGLDELPPECIISCALSRQPEALLSLEEIEAELLNCGPTRFSNLRSTTSVIDTFCQNDIEVFEILYIADFERHGQITKDTFLCQRYGLENIPLEGHAFEISVRFPENLTIECDLSIDQQTNPDSILSRTNNNRLAFPYFLGPRMTTIDTQIVVIDRIPIQTGISIQRERLVSFDTNNDGILEWVIVTDAQPIFEDSLVFDTLFVEDNNTFEEIPITDQLCNVIVSFNDTEIFKCASSRRVFREWTLIDWCANNASQSSTQLLDIIDTRPPELITEIDGQVFPISSINDVQTFIDPWSCFGQFRFPELNLRDDCGSEIDIIWESSVGIIQDSFITNIPKNNVPVSVRATLLDECQNESSLLFNVSVLDTITPAAVCVNQLTVSLTTDGAMLNGLTQINAVDLNGGSGDNGCDSISFGVLRFPVAPNATPPRGSESITLTCVDLARDFTLTLVVEDEARNRSTCEVNIIVQNAMEMDIDIRCDDVTVDCMEDRLPSPTILGDVCNDFFRALILLDEDLPELCLQNDRVREWFLDLNGDQEFNDDEPFCRQNIFISEESRFDPFSIQWPRHFNGQQIDGINIECDSTGNPNLILPQVVMMGDQVQCVTDISSFGRPFWCETECTLLAASLQTDTIRTSAFCMQLVNNWTIIDWCTFDPNGRDEDIDDDSFTAVEDWTIEECPACQNNRGPTNQENIYFKFDEVDIDGFYNFTQQILIVDDTAPSIAVADTQVAVTGGATSKTDETACVSDGMIMASATEFCGTESFQGFDLRWNILYDNGIDESESTFNGSEISIPTQEGSPGDVHMVTLTVFDGCGNSSTETISVTFSDSRAPTPICVTGVTTAFMQTDGTVQVWASDFDLGSFDNCTIAEELIFTIGLRDDDPANTEANIVFDCSNFDSLVDLNVFVTDQSGSSDFCEVRIYIGGECNNVVPEGAAVSLAGNVVTPLGEQIENVLVTINNNDLPEFPKSTVTDENGEFTFTNNPTNFDYEIIAERPEDYLNGISTLDLIQIQNHIVGLVEFENPFQYLAADINNNGSISSVDLVELRDLILARTTELRNNESWRFVDASQSFLETTNPWPFTETIRINNLLSESLSSNFIGVKIGDVSGDAIANNLIQSEIRTDGTLTFTTDNKSFVPGELIQVSISAKNFKNILGYQFTLNHSGLELQDIHTGILPISESNVSVKNGQLTMSWSDTQAVSTSEELFTLFFKANMTGQLRHSMEINSAITKAEAYNGIGNVFTTSTVDLLFNLSDEAGLFQLYQNTPNPFDTETLIGFDLPEAGFATLTVYDAAGRTLISKSENYSSGYNQITLSKNELSSSDVTLLYYELKTENNLAIKKMILLR